MKWENFKKISNFQKKKKLYSNNSFKICFLVFPSEFYWFFSRDKRWNVEFYSVSLSFDNIEDRYHLKFNLWLYDIDKSWI